MDSRVSISSSRRRIKALCGYIASAEANGQFGRVFTQISRVLIVRDPYLNTDAGTMSPFEHGEVFVLDDGGEVYVCISGLNKLSLLNMEGCPVTAACLETVAALPVLLFLNLSRCNLTDDGCEKCSGLQNLKVLNVGFNKEHHFSLLQRETEKLRK